MFFFGIGSLGLVAIGLLISTSTVTILSIVYQKLFVAITGNLILFLLGSSIAFKAESSLIALTVAALGSYIASVALAEKQNFRWVLDSSIAITTAGSTSFREANLTNANFSYATLRNTDFRNTVLTGTYWFKAQGLDFSRFGDSYLNIPKFGSWL